MARLMTLLSFALPLVVLVAMGCAKPIGNAGCQNAGDCDDGELCEDGECTSVAAGACQLDTDCTTFGHVCNIATSQCEPGAASGTCNSIADCPLTQSCNTSTKLCIDLPAGFCRDGSQCTADLPVCSAASEAVPGRCVQCVSADDCGGAACSTAGVCSDVQCQANATPSPDGTCFCEFGFVDDGFGNCVPEQAGEGEGEGEGEQPGGECDPAGGGFDCPGAPFVACSEDAQCVCDGLLLVSFCLLQNAAPDLEACVCAVAEGGP